MRRIKLFLFASICFTLIATSVSAADADPSAGDAAWAEIAKTPKATTKPAAAELADRLHAFYKKYPNHPKATDAWVKEQGLRQQVAGKPALAEKKAAPAAAAPATPAARAKVLPVQPRPRTVAVAVPQALSGPGKPFSLAFTAIDKRPVDLAEWRGKVILVDFWATWCGPCVAGMPEVKQVYSQYHDQGFEIVGISLDQDLDRLKQFVAVKGMPWPQFFDGAGWDNVVAKRHQIKSIPTMFLIDKKGNLRTTDARRDLPGLVAALLKE